MVVLPVAEWMSLDLEGAKIFFDYKMLKYTIPRKATTYDFSLDMNINSCVAQA